MAPEPLSAGIPLSKDTPCQHLKPLMVIGQQGSPTSSREFDPWCRLVPTLPCRFQGVSTPRPAVCSASWEPLCVATGEGKTRSENKRSKNLAFKCCVLIWKRAGGWLGALTSLLVEQLSVGNWPLSFSQIASSAHANLSSRVQFHRASVLPSTSGVCVPPVCSIGLLLSENAEGLCPPPSLGGRGRSKANLLGNLQLGLGHQKPHFLSPGSNEVHSTAGREKARH